MRPDHPHRARLALTAAATSALAVVLSAPGVASAAAPGEFRTSTHHLVPSGAAADGIFPEGIAIAGKKFYVGSTADGTIYRGPVNGRNARPFLPGGEDDRTSSIGMKVRDGRLFVAGGATGRVFAYNIADRRLVGSWQVAQTGAPTFLNDITIGRNGAVFVTDSAQARPVLYRIGPNQQRTNGVTLLRTFVDFTGTPFGYQPGNNANGIVTSRNGRFLLITQSNTGELFRVRVSNKHVTKVNLHGAKIAGDGLVLAGRTLFAVERQGDVGYIVKTRLTRKLGAGHVVNRTTYASFNDPTTAALVRNRLLVVNSQFGERAAGQQPGPFTVSDVPKP